MLLKAVDVRHGPVLDIERMYYGAVVPLLDFELFVDVADEFAYMQRC